MLIIFAGPPGAGKTTIARAIARAVARHLGAAYLRIDTIEQALRACGTLPGGVVIEGYAVAYRVAADQLALGGPVVAADVTRPADLDRLMDAAQGAFGHLDVLFVNAGVGAFAPLAQATAAHFDAIFDVNVKGAFFTVQRALPLLAPGASVILTGSVNGSTGAAGASVYSASKAAVRSLARTFSADLEQQGVRVNVISPGPVTTPIDDKLGPPTRGARRGPGAARGAGPARPVRRARGDRRRGGVPRL